MTCFNSGMEVVVRENIANKPMHNPPYVVGVLSAPDSHYQPVLYSHYQATKDFNQLNRDIFTERDKHKPADRKKTPVSVIVGTGIAACIALVFAGKKAFKHFFKK